MDFTFSPESQEPLNGGFSNGGVSRSGLVLPFFVLYGTFPIFPGFSRFARGWSRDLPDSSLVSFSAYQEHLRGTVPKGSATQSGPFPKKGGKPPGLETPRFSLSQESGDSCESLQGSRTEPLFCEPRFAALKIP